MIKKFTFTHDTDTLVMKVVSEICEQEGLHPKIEGDGTVIFRSSLSETTYQVVRKRLNTYGIQLTEIENEDIVGGIKRILKRIVDSSELRSKKVSSVLSDELGYSYSYLSNFFSKATYTSIENFLILLKIERAKKLLTVNKFSLSEIAHILDYSSVAHLSSQFKNVTGLTVSQFLKLSASRKVKLP